MWTAAFRFLSTLPARGATRPEPNDRRQLCSKISIHAPREGSDPPQGDDAGALPVFLSTLPARGATIKLMVSPLVQRISIHAPREGSDLKTIQSLSAQEFISIHAPREGSDLIGGRHRHDHRNFYPRSPRGERQSPMTTFCSLVRFLSTLPARGATRGGDVCFRCGIISIHAPREGSDVAGSRNRVEYPIFLSTLPARGATEAVGPLFEVDSISIHAPREGSDLKRIPHRSAGRKFLSTLPARGATDMDDAKFIERLFLSTLPARGATAHCWRSWSKLAFLSTLPARGATHVDNGQFAKQDISIHAPREGSDRTPGWRLRSASLFLSTLPARGATTVPQLKLADWAISIHAPREGSDCPAGCPPRRRHDFYPRSPRGERPSVPCCPPYRLGFLSTLPARGATFMDASPSGC